jgi:hypothetical protein
MQSFTLIKQFFPFGEMTKIAEVTAGAQTAVLKTVPKNGRAHRQAENALFSVANRNKCILLIPVIISV